MAAWAEAEIGQIAGTVRAIDSYPGPRRKSAPGAAIRMGVPDIGDLAAGLWGSFRVVFVRQLYNLLGFDEHRLFGWRLEHKLVQSLTLNHYCPGCMPATTGLDFLRASGGDELPGGVFVKPALGDSSGDLGITGAGAHIFAERAPRAGRLLDETWIVQERVPIAMEYRVHSLEDRVIEDLTFQRYGKGDIPGERDGPNEFVEGVLRCLPAGIVSGTLCGWDVARRPDGGFIVIEANFSGFHPVFNRGFQTSGWFHDAEWGALSCARLVRFVEDAMGIAVSINPGGDGRPGENQFYSEVDGWRRRLRAGEK